MGYSSLRDSEVLNALVFLVRLAHGRTSGRPKSRAFVEFLFRAIPGEGIASARAARSRKPDYSALIPGSYFCTLCPGAKSASNCVTVFCDAGCRSSGAISARGSQHKTPSRHLRMRNGQLRRIHDSISEQQNVDIDRARAFLDDVLPTHLLFQCAAIQRSVCAGSAAVSKAITQFRNQG